MKNSSRLRSAIIPQSLEWNICAHQSKLLAISSKAMILSINPLSHTQALISVFRNISIYSRSKKKMGQAKNQIDYLLSSYQLRPHPYKYNSYSMLCSSSTHSAHTTIFIPFTLHNIAHKIFISIYFIVTNNRYIYL